MIWHAPALTPALGAYLIIGLGAVAILLWLVERARRAPGHDPHADPYGDIPRGRDDE